MWVLNITSEWVFGVSIVFVCNVFEGRAREYYFNSCWGWNSEIDRRSLEVALTGLAERWRFQVTV